MMELFTPSARRQNYTYPHPRRLLGPISPKTKAFETYPWDRSCSSRRHVKDLLLGGEDCIESFDVFLLGHVEKTWAPNVK